MLTFLRPRSLDLAQDVDATLTRGGHMMGLRLDRHKHKSNYIDILSDDVDVVVVDVVVVVDDDDDPIELFQLQGRCWELIATRSPGPQAPQAPGFHPAARVVVQRVVGARNLRATTSLVR